MILLYDKLGDRLILKLIKKYLIHFKMSHFKLA